MKLHLLAIPAELNHGDRNILWLLSAAFFIGQYDMTLLSIALPDIQAAFGIAEQDIGKLVAVGRLGAIPAVLLALVADRIGRRRLLVVTMVGLALSNIATACALSAEQFMYFQASARLFTTVEEILAVIFVLELLPDKHRGWGVGFLAAMGALGSGLAAVLYGAVAYLPGEWRALYVVGACAIFYVAWLRRKLPESPLFARQQTSPKNHYWAPLQALFMHHRREILVLLTIAGVFWFQVSTTLNFMSKFLQDNHGYTPAEVSVLFIAAGTIAIFGNVIAGRVSDRFGRKPTLVLAIAIYSAAASAFYNTDGWLLPITWMAAVFCYFAVEVVVGAISGELFPTSCRSTAASLRTVTGVLAGAAGLAVEGGLYSLFGSHGPALAVMALTALIALPVTLLFLRETANTRLL
ncbi:MAG: MFS transporter [Halioglobus sp.]|nr:MFS transporter [Halioglobus sp.]